MYHSLIYNLYEIHISLHISKDFNPMFSQDLKVIAQGGMPRTSSHFRGEWPGKRVTLGMRKIQRHQISLHWTNILYPNWMHQPVVLCIQVCTHIHIFGSQQKTSPKNDTQFYRAINCWKRHLRSAATSVWLFRTFDMLPHWSEVGVSKMFDSTKHHFFWIKN